jgi:hypothetical protein
MNEKILSVKELNEVLTKLQNNQKLEDFDTFSEVDIVFIAGLLLWYNINETKISLRFRDSPDYKTFKITEYVLTDDKTPKQEQKTIRFSSNVAFFRLTKYLEQFNSIFNKQIKLEVVCSNDLGKLEIINLQNVTRIDNIAENLPLSFVPILYINELSFDWLFRNVDNHKIRQLKGDYISILEEQRSNKKKHIILKKRRISYRN